MMDSRTTLSQVQQSLQARGLARLDAQLLLLHVLGSAPSQRGWLLAHDTDLLPITCAAALETLAQRRLAGEPLAYLTGTKAFYRMDLQVNPGVLVPRPDTETLVDWALELLQGQPAGNLLDLGTGSGAIALALKSSQPDWQVWATDISPPALAVAQANAQHLNLPVQLRLGAWFAALPLDAPHFDCIVSNPPYIAEHDPHLAALRYEPQQALTSGPDGMNDLRQIIRQAPAHLKAGGWLLLEHGFDQAGAVRQLLHDSSFVAVQSRNDLAGISRCSGGQWPG
jgi:release factor glutamine methyltransferase